jgi:hypothetical protein
MNGFKQVFDQFFNGNLRGDYRNHGKGESQEKSDAGALPERKDEYIFHVLEAGRKIGERTKVGITEKLLDVLVAMFSPFCTELQRSELADCALQAKRLGSRLSQVLPYPSSSVRFRQRDAISGNIGSRPGEEDISYVNEEQADCSSPLRRSLE